ncbi:cytochrome P450 [Nonomuraea maheshkhaliensis]|uniref:Cytochrome P450 n=1 Tax=Nonomuraea maheshkhaliensis TaxID=419590 RepID=A0ABN2H7B7_9ACTN
MSERYQPVPGPPGRFLVGNTYEYDQDRLAFLARAQRDYGDVFRFSPTAVVVQDPELIHDVLVRTNAEFRAESPLVSGAAARFQELIDRRLPVWMSTRRKGWRGMNAAGSAAYGSRLLRQFAAIMDERAGREVEVLSLMKSFSGQAIADFCLGGQPAHRQPAHGEPAHGEPAHGEPADGQPVRGEPVRVVAEAVERAATAASALMASSLTLPHWWPTPRIRRFRRTAREVRSVLLEQIAARRAAGARPHPEDLLDELLHGEGAELSDEAVYDVLNVVLRASHGVPGASLSWIVRQFALDPDLAARVRKEAGDARLTTPDDPPDPAALPYTEAVIKEVLRMYPPTWLMGRDIVRETRVGEWNLRPGQQVMFCTYLVHRDPRWWTYPEEFLPERWLGGDVPHSRYAYLPFGAGPRICLGNQLGMTQLVLATAWLAARFDIEVSDLDSAVPAPQALLVPRGLRAVFHPRA